ncbi:hypothetical protein MGYG_06376 [Nannizzia gypsea CBS 118893]|uniref:Zn(2)-C6 fungal-type domain-containing protein n=1 Tax=Arthroderma gypseum (strain ATCC MYA-4604 / CBS 118893) TaxID=535722 RepID=E4UZ47_ARTGP|nr:hypothetical protein MGYG_06376 [Nannizzia gypsea CBS 118893]EFR03377.1 hypothetical protein MGYG_06376 [Nannizzia gypsea CBS 118893]
MADVAQKKQPKQRKSFQIETRFGGARELKSRKDRPCDACRQRKTACVIVTKPPCRFCESKCVTCSFISTPKPRRRSPAKGQEKDAEHSAASPPTTVSPNSRSPAQHSEASVFHSPPDHLSMIGIGALSPVSMLSVSDHEQYTAPTTIPGYPAAVLSHHHPSAIPVSGPGYYHAQEYSYFAHPTPPSHPISPAADNLNHITGHTAHFMGMPGEQQDMGLLSSFRSAIINQSNHHANINFNHIDPTAPTQSVPPAHFSAASNWFSERDHEGKPLAPQASHASHISGGMEGIVGGQAQANSLVRLYFEHIHPTFPVLSKGRFLREYMQDKHNIPPSLRGAVYTLAAPFSATLPESQPINQTVLSEHVHASLNKELESPQLPTLQACLLILHHLQPTEQGPVQSSGALALSAQAVSCAHALGLHHDDSAWDIPVWEKKLRRKLWWATYYTDRWTAVCHGSPPHIHNSTFDTRDVEIEDLVYDEDMAGHASSVLVREGDHHSAVSSAVRFIERIKVAKMLDTALGCPS